LSSPYAANNLPPEADLFIVGNAGLPRGNPELEAVLESGKPYVSGAEWLGRYALQGKWVIAVAGTHGKTTTSSMVAWILEQAGMSPGFLIGGIPRNFGYSARAGESDFFVIEADEYDTSYFDHRSKFLHYRPRTLILNNLEYDHADIFPDLAAIQNQFHLLLRTIPESGQIIRPTKDANLDQVIEMGCWTPRVSFGHKGSQGTDLSAEVFAKDGSHFAVNLQDQYQGEISWELTGTHNVLNALAAIGAARHVGVRTADSIEALRSFKNAKRRMEVIYQDAQITVYDDFAHHPTAISSTLEGLRNKVGKEKILAIVEPGSHTMRKGTHQNSLPTSTNAADEVIWFEPAAINWDLRSIAQNVNHRVTNDQNELLKWTHGFITSDPAHIVILSNSGFGGFHQKLVTQLQSQ